MPEDLSFDLSDSFCWEVMFLERKIPELPSESPKKDKDDTVSDPSKAVGTLYGTRVSIGPCVSACLLPSPGQIPSTPRLDSFSTLKTSDAF